MPKRIKATSKNKNNFFDEEEYEETDKFCEEAIKEIMEEMNFKQ